MARVMGLDTASRTSRRTITQPSETGTRAGLTRHPRQTAAAAGHADAVPARARPVVEEASRESARRACGSGHGTPDRGSRASGSNAFRDGGDGRAAAPASTRRRRSARDRGPEPRRGDRRIAGGSGRAASSRDHSSQPKQAELGHNDKTKVAAPYARIRQGVSYFVKA